MLNAMDIGNHQVQRPNPGFSDRKSRTMWKSLLFSLEMAAPKPSVVHRNASHVIALEAVLQQQSPGDSNEHFTSASSISPEGSSETAMLLAVSSSGDGCGSYTNACYTTHKEEQAEVALTTDAAVSSSNDAATAAIFAPTSPETNGPQLLPLDETHCTNAFNVASCAQQLSNSSPNNNSEITGSVLSQTEGRVMMSNTTFYAELEDEDDKLEKNVIVVPEGFGLEYHGILSKANCEKRMLKDGDYLIRKSPTKKNADHLILSLRFDGKLKHYLLQHDSAMGTYRLPPSEESFTSIHDLVVKGFVTLYLESRAAQYLTQQQLLLPSAFQSPLDEGADGLGSDDTKSLQQTRKDSDRRLDSRRRGEWDEFCKKCDGKNLKRKEGDEALISPVVDVTKDTICCGGEVSTADIVAPSTIATSDKPDNVNACDKTTKSSTYCLPQCRNDDTKTKYSLSNSNTFNHIYTNSKEAQNEVTLKRLELCPDNESRALCMCRCSGPSLSLRSPSLPSTPSTPSSLKDVSYPDTPYYELTRSLRKYIARKESCRSRDGGPVSADALQARARWDEASLEATEESPDTTEEKECKVEVAGPLECGEDTSDAALLPENPDAARSSDGDSDEKEGDDNSNSDGGMTPLAAPLKEAFSRGGLKFWPFKAARKDQAAPATGADPEEISGIPHHFKVQTFKFTWCAICAHFLFGVRRQGVRCTKCRLAAHQACAAAIPNDCTPQLAELNGIFGKDLSTLMAAVPGAEHPLSGTPPPAPLIHREPLPPQQHDLVPLVVRLCVAEIEARGLEAEGLYRVSGGLEDIQTARIALEKGGGSEVISEEAMPDVNAVAGVLKLFLRQLPVPLITARCFSALIKACELGDPEEQLYSVRAALLLLPPAHYHTLLFLLRHFHRIVSECSTNKMTSTSLSLVFAPTLVQPASAATPPPPTESTSVAFSAAALIKIADSSVGIRHSAIRFADSPSVSVVEDVTPSNECGSLNTATHDEPPLAPSIESTDAEGLEPRDQSNSSDVTKEGPAADSLLSDDDETLPSCNPASSLLSTTTGILEAITRRASRASIIGHGDNGNKKTSGAVAGNVIDGASISKDDDSIKDDTFPPKRSKNMLPNQRNATIVHASSNCARPTVSGTSSSTGTTSSVNLFPSAGGIDTAGVTISKDPVIGSPFNGFLNPCFQSTGSLSISVAPRADLTPENLLCMKFSALEPKVLELLIDKFDDITAGSEDGEDGVGEEK